MSNWMGQIERNAVPNIRKIMVGNKCDLADEKIISKDRGDEKA